MMMSQNDLRKTCDVFPEFDKHLLFIKVAYLLSDKQFIMCDVTKDNFDSILPELFGHIDKCAFIAFDCEFTALDPAQNGDHNSLFDRRPALTSLVL